MAKTKKYYAELVMRNVNSRDLNRDQKLDIREVYAKLDALVNRYARLNLFENMQLGDRQTSENFITTFKEVAVEGPDFSGGLKYCKLPAKYAALPHGKGIDEVAPSRKPTIRIIPITHRQYKQMQRSYALHADGLESFFPEGDRIYFAKKNTEHETVNIRLVITDASSISNTAEYPIPPDYEDEILTKATEFFLQVNSQPQDDLNDGKQVR